MTHGNAMIERCVSSAVERMRNEPAPLLEILHAVQDQLGFVPPESVPLIADALNLSRAEVHGVVSFYHHFRDVAPGRHTLGLCRAEACKAMNADALAEFAQKRLGLGFGETRADRLVTLEAVYCLGNCACAPSALIDGEIRGRIDAQTISEFAQRCGVPE
jgi:formate dehydrogenase subunit gamma